MGKVTFFSSEHSDFSLSHEFPFLEELSDTPATPPSSDDVTPKSTNQFALLEFEKPVSCPAHSTVIGSRLDIDHHSNMCRIAFQGALVLPIVERDYHQSVLPRLRVFKHKSREGVVERVRV